MDRSDEKELRTMGLEVGTCSTWLQLVVRIASVVCASVVECLKNTRKGGGRI